MAKYQTWELTPNEVLEGLVVTQKAGAGNEAILVVSAGRARIDGKLVEVAQTEVTNTTVGGASGTELVLYINPDKDYAGNALTRISFTKEADTAHTNLIGGTVGIRYSRSLPLAKMKTLANVDDIDPTTIDNNYRELFEGYTGMRSEMGN